jgi:hypothetical protein
MTGLLADLVGIPALSEAIDAIVSPAASTPRSEHVITDVPMTELAAEYVTGTNAADIIKAYFEPQVTSPKRGSDQLWHIYGDIAMSVMPTGCVAWIGEREWPDEAKVDPLSGRRTRTTRGTGGTVPGGFSKSRNGTGGSRRGHRGGHRHPTTVKDLLDRCRAAGLDVEELPNKGGHWKISCPEGWTRPRRATSGVVFVSSTTEFRAIAKNTNKLLRETGIDVRQIDPAAIRRRGRQRTTANESDQEMTATLTAPDTTEAESEEVAPVATSAPGASPAGRLSAGAGGGTPQTATDQTADRLRFVAEMRAEGHTDSAIAEAIGISPNNLAAFLSIQRTNKHPLAVPARKAYTDPETGVVTQAGSLTRGGKALTTRPVAAPVTTTRPTAAPPTVTPPTYRREVQPVTEAEITKLLGAVRNLGKISRTDIVKLFWRRKRRTEIDALIAAATAGGQVRVVTEQRTKYGYPTTLLEWVAEPEPEAEPEPDQRPETDTVAAETAAPDEAVPAAAEVAGPVEPVVSFEEAQQLVAGIIADRDQVIAEGAAAIEELVGQHVEVPAPVEPELPGPAVEVEPERVDAAPETDPATVPDTVVEPEPDDPVAEPESTITLADLYADLVERRQEAASGAQDGPGAPNDTVPVSQAAEDHSEPLSGPAGRPARYATTCAVCSGEIRLGALIVPVRHKWQHARHEGGVQAAPVATGPAGMPTAVTVLEAALRRVGVADPELVARNLRFELADGGWKLSLEAAL